MTIEDPVFVFAAGIILVAVLITLVAVLIWQTHRLTRRRLAKIQNDLDALHQASQWLLVKGLNRESDGTARSELVEKITPRRGER
jgi:Na+/melibiose symporter-like transporter